MGQSVIVELNNDGVCGLGQPSKPSHTCTHADVHACMDDTHNLHGSLLFMSSPNALIFGLPGTAMITSQTVIKEYLVDVFSRCA